MPAQAFELCAFEVELAGRVYHLQPLVDDPVGAREVCSVAEGTGGFEGGVLKSDDGMPGAFGRPRVGLAFEGLAAHQYQGSGHLLGLQVTGEATDQLELRECPVEVAANVR